MGLVEVKAVRKFGKVGQSCMSWEFSVRVPVNESQNISIEDALDCASRKLSNLDIAQRFAVISKAHAHLTFHVIDDHLFTITSVGAGEYVMDEIYDLLSWTWFDWEILRQIETENGDNVIYCVRFPITE